MTRCSCENRHTGAHSVACDTQLVGVDADVAAAESNPGHDVEDCAEIGGETSV